MRTPERLFGSLTLCNVMNNQPENVDDYILSAPEEVQEKLRQVRAAILAVAPTAKERISYKMPFYDYKGRLAWFGLHANHIGLYLRPPVIEEHSKDLEEYETTKSAVHLPLDKSMPVALIKKLVKARMKMNEAETTKPEPPGSEEP